MCVQWVVGIRNQSPCSSFGTCKLFAKLISFDVRYTNVTQYSGYVARQMLHHRGSNQLISQLRHSTQTIHVTSFSSRGCHCVWWECVKCKAQAQLLNMLQTWKVLSLHLKSHSAAFFHTHWYSYAVTLMDSLSSTSSTIPHSQTLVPSSSLVLKPSLFLTLRVAFTIIGRMAT